MSSPRLRALFCLMTGIDRNRVNMSELESSETGASERAGRKPLFLSRKLLVPAAAVAVIAVTLAVWRPWSGEGKKAAIKPAEAPQAIPADLAIVPEMQMKELAVETVSEKNVQVERETTGKVTFNEDRLTPVFTPYNGRVIEVRVNKGDLVKKGQPLLVMESPDLVAAQNDLFAARADLDKDRISFDIATKAAERARRLNAQEALSTKDLQEAEADLARAQEELRRAEAARAVAENRLLLFGIDRQQIENLEQQTAHMLENRVVLRAPIAGTIVERKVGVGQYIKPDSPEPFFLLSDLSVVWVQADVYEIFLPQIRLGAPVEVRVASFPDRVFQAKVSFVNPTVDTATRTIHVHCVVPNPGYLLKPDMFAKIRIGEPVAQKIPVIPSRSIISQNNGAYVFVEESVGRYRRRQVKTGSDIQGMTAVEDGLKAGDRVVTRGVLLLNSIVGKPPETKSEKSE